MGYQVWVSEYGDTWKRADCETLDEAKAEILMALKEGKEPVLTESIDFELRLSFKEPKEERFPQPAVKTRSERIETKEVDKSGAEEGKPTADKSTGG